jgi:phage-related tail fiber protein
MLIDGIQLPRTSVVSGMALERLTTFPDNPVKGQSFFLTETVGDFDPGQYTFGGVEWSAGSGGNPYSDAKESVRVATTENITLNGLKTIDGITVADKDRVLVKNQTDPKQNGIWQVVASGNWVRAKDASNAKGLNSGMYTFVTEGQANQGTGWVLNTPDPIVLDTTGLAFQQFSGTGNISAGAGLQRVGNSFSLLSIIGLTPGTYRSVTIDQYGRVTGGTNPSTLAGYGITDGQQIITGAATSITTNNLTANRVMVSDASGKVSQSTITTSELATIKSNSDNMQALLNGKQATITGAASTVVSTNLNPDVLVGTDANGKMISTTALLSEVNQLSGVTSNVQTQINTKLNKAGDTLTGHLIQAAAPTVQEHLVNKQYVDQQVSSLASQPRSIFVTVPGEIVPFEGTLRWYPPFPISVSACRIFQGVAPTITDTVVDVRVNATTSVFTGAKPTITTNNHESTLVSSNAPMGVDDFLVIDVDQGSGEDLSIRIDYTTE